MFAICTTKWCCHYMISSDNQNDLFYVAEGIVVNLTRIFGIENEPSAGQIDDLLSRYPGAYNPKGQLLRGWDLQ